MVYFQNINHVNHINCVKIYMFKSNKKNVTLPSRSGIRAKKIVMQLQSALREFDFLHNEEKGGPQGANLRPLVTEPRPVLIAPPSPRTPSPQPVVEFPEDEVHTSTYTQHCFACFQYACRQISETVFVVTYFLFVL